jgi:hypothetical protein
MIYKAGSRFKLRQEVYNRDSLRSHTGTVIKAYPDSDLRQVIRDGLRTPETWHIYWFTREHK